MGFAGANRSGRFAARLASIFAPPYMGRFYLAKLTRRPFIDPRAEILHHDLCVEDRVFIADRVVIYGASDGGRVTLHESAHVLRDSVLETGQGGSIEIGRDTFIHPKCQVMAYIAPIQIGDHVAIAPGCAFYAYNHGFDKDGPIKKLPLQSKGGITIGDGAWLGYGVIVLDGVSIGEGAVIGAGAVVTDDVPPNSIAVGNPARVVSARV